MSKDMSEDVFFRKKSSVKGEVCEFENNVRLRNYGFRLLELFGYLNLLSVAAEHYVEKCNNK